MTIEKKCEIIETLEEIRYENPLTLRQMNAIDDAIAAIKAATPNVFEGQAQKHKSSIEERRRLEYGVSCMIDQGITQGIV